MASVRLDITAFASGEMTALSIVGSIAEKKRILIIVGEDVM